MIEFVEFAPEYLEFAFSLAVAADPRWGRVSDAGMPNPLRFGSTLAEGASLIKVIVVSDRPGAESVPLGIAGLWNVYDNRTAELDVVISPGAPDFAALEAAATDHMLEVASSTGLQKLFMRHDATAQLAARPAWDASREVLMPSGWLTSSGELIDVAVDTFTRSERR